MKGIPYKRLLIAFLFSFISAISLPAFISASEVRQPAVETTAAAVIEPAPQAGGRAESAAEPDKHPAPDAGAANIAWHDAEMPLEGSGPDIKPDIKNEQPAFLSYDSNPVAEKAVDKSISLFANTIKEKFSLWLSRSGKYLDMMKGILKTKNIPEDIVFLSLIESGFNPAAYSVARAAGPWQFISSTAKRYGLKIDWWRDERRDPIKSTEAAADYLSDLYQMFGSWNLAMAAYNAGEGKILKAMNRSKSDDYWALLNTKYLKRETKEYVPRFIAARLIANNPESYGFENLDYHMPLRFDEVPVTSQVDLEIAARCAETTVETIKELNPELRRWSTPTNVSPYMLRIPPDKKDIFLRNLSLIPEDQRFTINSYTVKKGDTVSKISKKSGIPVKVILALNEDAKSLASGRTIYLPPKDKYRIEKDDVARTKKVAHRSKKTKARNKKIVVASLNKKESFSN